MRKPKINIVQGYKDIFDEKPPEYRLSFLEKLSFQHVLVEIVALNYRLKPAQKIFIDNSWETQNKELEKFTYKKENHRYVLSKCSKYFKKDGTQPNFFSRQSCLFAIEELLSSELKTIPDFEMNREEVWYNIFKYLLCVNSAISDLKNKTDEGLGFESINPKLLSLNELSIESDPLLTPLRGRKLIRYLEANKTYSSHIKEYLLQKYGLSAKEFFKSILHYSLSKKFDNDEINFFFPFAKDIEPSSFAIGMSMRNHNSDTHKLLNIRKSPLIKCWDNNYILADNILLLEKSYYQLINDFWFDYLKPLKTAHHKPLFKIENYKSTIGYFIESYCDDILRKLFAKYNYSILKTFDDLKLPLKSGEIEIADFYFRYGKRTIIGQIKSGTIYDNEKFGADLESLYKNDREKFFENFGVNQVVASILRLEEHATKIDSKYPAGNRIIYPVIVFNDRLFQTALMPFVFNKRFQELISNFNVKKLTIKPLTIMHISDIEQLELAIGNSPQKIWDVLEKNCSEPKYMNPLFDTLSKMGLRYRYNDELVEEIRKEIEEQ